MVRRGQAEFRQLSTVVALGGLVALAACAGRGSEPALVIESVTRVESPPPAGVEVAMPAAAVPEVEPPRATADATAVPPAAVDGPCSYTEKLRCKKKIGNLAGCSRCGTPPRCGDGVCAEDETDATCGADCGCAAEGHACGAVAPFGCYCDGNCAATGDCCADVAAVCRGDSGPLASLAPPRRR